MDLVLSGLHLQPKQLGRVTDHHLIYFVFRYSDKVLRDLLLGIGKRTFGVGIIGPPHETIHSNEFAGQNASSVILERGPELALEIRAGRLIELGLHPVAMVLPPMVH